MEVFTMTKNVSFLGAQGRLSRPMATRYSEKCFAVKAQKLWLSERQIGAKTPPETTRNSDRVPNATQKSKTDVCLTFKTLGEDVTLSKSATRPNQGKKRGRPIHGTFSPASCRYEDHRYSRAQSAHCGTPLTVHAVGYNTEPGFRSLTPSAHGASKTEAQAIRLQNSKPFHQTVRQSSSLTNISKISTANDLKSVLQVSHCQLSSRWAIDTGAISRLRETLKKRRARTAFAATNREKPATSADHIARDNKGQSQAPDAQMAHGPRTGEVTFEGEVQRASNSPDTAGAEQELTPPVQSDEDEVEIGGNSEDISLVPTAEFVDFSVPLNIDDYKKRPRSVSFCRTCAEKDFVSREAKQCGQPQELRDKFRRFLRPTLATESLPQMVVYQWEAKQTDSGRPKMHRRSHTAPTPSMQRMYKRVIEIDLRGIPRCTSSEQVPGTPPGSPRIGYGEAWGERLWRLDGYQEVHSRKSQ